MAGAREKAEEAKIKYDVAEIRKKYAIFLALEPNPKETDFCCTFVGCELYTSPEALVQVSTLARDIHNVLGSSELIISSGMAAGHCYNSGSFVILVKLSKSLSKGTCWDSLSKSAVEISPWDTTTVDPISQSAQPKCP